MEMTTEITSEVITQKLNQNYMNLYIFVVDALNRFSCGMQFLMTARSAMIIPIFKKINVDFML